MPDATCHHRWSHHQFTRRGAALSVGYDAVHLAAASIRQEGMGEQVTMAVFDKKLWAAAGRVGLILTRPNCRPCGRHGKRSRRAESARRPKKRHLQAGRVRSESSLGRRASRSESSSFSVGSWRISFRLTAFGFRSTMNSSRFGSNTQWGRRIRDVRRRLCAKATYSERSRIVRNPWRRGKGGFCILNR